MATQITNTASATYGYGRDGQDSAISNVATTNLIEEFAISGSKTPLKLDFRPGENIPYQIYLQNDGTQPLFNVTVVDDLGGVGTPLSYVLSSATLNVNGTNTPIIPTSVNPLTFVLPSSLGVGDRATITFITRVNAGLSSSVNTITNTSTITANEGSATGAAISVDPVPTSTITLEDFALLAITKDVSSNEIVPGQTFSYTINLENSGNLDANGVIITDVLPEGFTISAVSVLSNGVQTTLTENDYTVDSSTNTLTLPTGTAVSISVPALRNGVAGTSSVTITGSIS